MPSACDGVDPTPSDAAGPVPCPAADFNACPPEDPQARPFQAPLTVTPVDGWSDDLGPSVATRKDFANGGTALFERYNWQSSYFGLELWDLDSNARISHGDDSCPIWLTDREGTNCIPTTLGLYALEKYSKYVTKASDAEADRARFLDVVQWFMVNQDQRGGWAFKYKSDWWTDRAAMLEPGWYSAMAQGLGISALVRAFYLTGEQRYLDAARRAVAVLRTRVEDGGVMRRVFGHVFYEEYPTVPMSNVLNGYIYSLIGLYDLSRVAREPIYGQYFNEGVSTIRALISFYDLGGFSSYDLSHLQHPGSPPNRTNWGYHSVHITQLSWLRTVTGDNEFFTPLIDRWVGYLDGAPVQPN